MPMFDDPGRALRKLEEELRAAETPEESEEGWEDSPVNYAVDFDRMAYADEETYDEDVYYEEDYKAARKAEKKRKSIAKLKLIIFLELVGIAAVIGWWVKWLF